MIQHPKEINFDIHEEELNNEIADWTLFGVFFKRKAFYDMYAGPDYELKECIEDFFIGYQDKCLETIENVQRSKRPKFISYEDSIIELRYKNKLIVKGKSKDLLHLYNEYILSK